MSRDHHLTKVHKCKGDQNHLANNTVENKVISKSDICLSINELFKTTFVSVVEKLRSGSKTNHKDGFSSVFPCTITQKYSGEWCQHDGGLGDPNSCLPHKNPIRQTTTNRRKQPKDSTGLWSSSKNPREFQNRLRIVVWKSTPLFKKYLCPPIPQPRAAWHQEGCPGRKFTTWGKRENPCRPPQQLRGRPRAAPAAVVSYCLHQRCSCISSQKV